MDSDEEELCPLCCTELDVTDRAIQYCECGCEGRGARQTGAGRGGAAAAAARRRRPAPACRLPASSARCLQCHRAALLQSRACGAALPHPCLPAADQMCLFCYNQILDEAAKASLAAKCPNCRSEYDEEKIKMQHIDAEQCVAGALQFGMCRGQRHVQGPEDRLRCDGTTPWLPRAAAAHANWRIALPPAAAVPAAVRCAVPSPHAVPVLPTTAAAGWRRRSAS